MIALLAASGCKRKEWSADAVDPRFIKIDSELMHLDTGEVGVGKHKSQATFVLVDAVNESDRDLEVTLGGDLVDDSGKVLGPLTLQSLRINSGARRTFALVAKKQKVFDGAASAKVEVKGTLIVDYEETVRIEEGRVYDDRGRAVVKGYVHNVADRPVRTIVIGSFYDKDGRPLERPSTLLELSGGGRRGVHFVGPEGSVSAILFIGETVY